MGHRNITNDSSLRRIQWRMNEISELNKEISKLKNKIKDEQNEINLSIISATNIGYSKKEIDTLIADRSEYP